MLGMPASAQLQNKQLAHPFQSSSLLHTRSISITWGPCYFGFTWPQNEPICKAIAPCPLQVGGYLRFLPRLGELSQCSLGMCCSWLRMPFHDCNTAPDDPPELHDTRPHEGPAILPMRITPVILSLSTGSRAAVCLLQLSHHISFPSVRSLTLYAVLCGFQPCLTHRTRRRRGSRTSRIWACPGSASFWTQPPGMSRRVAVSQTWVMLSVPCTTKSHCKTSRCGLNLQNLCFAPCTHVWCQAN